MPRRTNDFVSQPDVCLVRSRVAQATATHQAFDLLPANMLGLAARLESSPAWAAADALRHCVESEETRELSGSLPIDLRAASQAVNSVCAWTQKLQALVSARSDLALMLCFSFRRIGQILFKFLQASCAEHDPRALLEADMIDLDNRMERIERLLRVLDSDSLSSL